MDRMGAVRKDSDAPTSPDPAAPLTPPSADAPSETIDGRSLRRQRNRERVIIALLELIREGSYDPSAAEIAERAEVSHRSVFRYFDDLDDMVRAAVDYETQRAIPLAVIERIGEGPLGERIERLVDSRMRVYQHTHGVGRVARARAIGIPAIDEELISVIALFRTQVANHFEPELKLMAEEQATMTMDALQSMMSFESYDFLRRRVQADDDRIRRSWIFGIARLFDTP